LKFFRRSELSSSQLSILFLVKVLVGIFYGWIGINYGNTAEAGDTWWLHWKGVKEYKLLLTDPGDFIYSVFHSPYPGGYGNFFSSSDSWWNDIKNNTFLKFLALLNVFSFGNYYVNLIMYSFITFFGTVAFYRVMKDVFPTQKIAVLLGCFFLPSFIYWGSGVHKDGLIFLAISMIVFNIYFYTRERKIRVFRLTAVLLWLLLILFLRNFMLVTLLPALIAWVVSYKVRYKPLVVFSVFYCLFALLFFTAKYIHPSLDFPAATASRQESFVRLNGESEVTVQKLDPNIIGFVKSMPQAFYLTVLRPTFSDVKNLLGLAAFAEVYLYLFFFVIFLIWRNKDLDPDQRFVIFCVFFGFSVLMMVGYTVNNLGAIARY
jgi:hypothetical protein